jgi:outer membrane protein OmpA-like peptidoglycan-associated protein
VQPAPAPPPVAAPAPPPAPAPFDLAVERAATVLFDAADRIPGIAEAPPRPVMIDPLIDGNTAQQTVSSDAMGGKIASLVSKRYPKFAVAPFRKASLERNPLLLVGTLTAIKSAPTNERNDVFRICLALVDVRAGKVIAKGVGRATEQTVDATPLPYYSDSPSWVKDRTTEGYIRTCQGTRAGDLADLLYIETLPTSMVLDEAVQAYHARDFAEAGRLYRTAAALPGGEQKRVINGLYLTSWKLRRVRDAEDAFGKLVVRGIEEHRLGIKFLFRPGSVQYIAEPDLQAQYAMWTNVIADRAADSKACLVIVGHASRTGSDELNDALSLKRAEVTRRAIERHNAAMRDRMKAEGAGARETIVGTGTDDLRDALDRRVEFKIVDC